MVQQVNILCGPTCSGKDEIAFEFAQRHNIPIICMDSMKIYKRMEIGTDKPTPQMRKKVKYYMIDIREPNENFDVYNYITEVNNILKNLKVPPLISGGTFLYMKAFLYGIFTQSKYTPTIREEIKEKLKKVGNINLYKELENVDPKAALKIHPNDTKRIIRALEVYYTTGIPISQLQTTFNTPRPDIKANIVALIPDRRKLYERINRRVDIMIEKGLLRETKQIYYSCGFGPQASQSIGYKECIWYIENKIPYGRMIDLIKRNTRRLAKHQFTWINNLKIKTKIEIENKNKEEIVNMLERIFL